MRSRNLYFLEAKQLQKKMGEKDLLPNELKSQRGANIVQENCILLPYNVNIYLTKARLILKLINNWFLNRCIVLIYTLLLAIMVLPFWQYLSDNTNDFHNGKLNWKTIWKDFVLTVRCKIHYNVLQVNYKCFNIPTRFIRPCSLGYFFHWNGFLFIKLLKQLLH